ncbi:MAG: hypothetical protein U0271_40030 [Polyangiaceae bacterium]
MASTEVATDASPRPASLVRTENEQILRQTEQEALAWPLLVSERADAIRALREINGTRPGPPVAGAPCVIVHESPVITSMMCFVPSCGEPAAWIPMELLRATGEFRQQQC